MSDFVRRTAPPLWAFVACASVAVITAFAATSDAPPAPRATIAAPPSSAQPGQTSTLLSNGDRLLLGGQGANGQVSAQAVIVDAQSGKAQTLSRSLNVPRAGHSASVLPDGSVLIVGGVNGSGQPIADVERYYPESRQFENLGDIGLPARASQSTTLLSDGRLLIVGGTDVSSRVHGDAVLLDPSTLTATPVTGGLAQARAGQQARLLANGDVQISGGRDQSGRLPDGAELFNPASGTFRPLDAASAAALVDQDQTRQSPAVIASYPVNASGGVAVDAQLAFRFSKPLQPQSLTDQTVTLFGPKGPVETTVVAAEGGMLAFVTPKQQLFPGTRYTLFVKGARDAKTELPFTAVGFETATLPQTSKSAQALVLQREYVPPADADGEMWLPRKRNLTGIWRSGQAEVARAHIPNRRSLARQLHNNPGKGSLPEAPPGVTAVAGQVLRLNGAPLPNATLSIGGKSVKTDRSGEFLLADVPAGTQVLVIDGSTANEGKRQYGRYEYRAVIEAGKTNALPFVIWMTRLDTRNAITIPSPTRTETVVTNPRIPGLELRIPAGTVIRDSQGRNVTEITMTAIPVDQPPFPLPNVQVPVYFTVQPGGAHLQGLNVQSAKGARLIYPNFSNMRPGARADFWNYDPRAKGWYVYGQGTVSADAKRVVPDQDVVIYEFTGAMIGGPGNAPGDGPPGGGGPGNGPGPGGGGDGGDAGGDGGPNGDGGDPGDGSGSGSGGGGCDSGAAQAGDPVDCFTGLFIYDHVDLKIHDTLPIEVHRTYRPRDSASRAFGVGTNLSYDLFLVGDTIPWTYMDLVVPNGGKVHFTRTSSGTEFRDAVYSTNTPGKYQGAVIRWNAQIDTGWLLTFPNGAVYTFPEAFQSPYARCGAPVAMRDRYGNTISLQRDSACNLTSITSPNGRRITLTYDASNRITQAVDDLGRTVTYQYDANGRLITATDALNHSEAYTYDSADRMLSVTDKRGHVKINNVYDSNGRVSQQIYADSSSANFSYVLSGSGVATQMDFTDTGGAVRRVQFNASGYPTSLTRALGRPEQQVTTFTRDATTNRVTSAVDALGRMTTYQYDSIGNLTQATYLSGTPGAVSWIYTYQPAFGRLTSVTDPSGHSSSYTYDTFGNRITATDGVGSQTSMTYTASGALATISRTVGASVQTTTFSYSGGDLSGVTDALGRTTSYFRDGAGRLVAVRNPLGAISHLAYDALDRVTQSVDALGNSVQYAYDENGNVLSVLDPRGGTTTFAYDARNRLTSFTDPLLHSESYAYDAVGNRTRITDRTGQVSTFTYDYLKRVTSAGFGATVSNPTNYGSTISYTWDAGNRVTQLVDSTSGAIVRVFDGLDRLTQEQTPQSQVSYAYYPNGTRQSMTMQGQTAVSYAYDNADRLTQITHGAATVSFGYDAAGRRSALTLPNGVVTSYTYDDAGQLTGLTYQKGTTSIGTLTYAYDAAGRRIGVGGGLARTNLPPALASATYDAANKLMTWGSSNLTYDDNGSLTSMGSRTYSWDSRRQLVATSDGSASFSYDGFGRRVGRNLDGSAVAYSYDGVNPVTVGNTFVLGGLGVDERYSQTTSSTSQSYIADASGQTIQLTDDAGAVSADYSYDPYGGTSHTGAADTAFQFGGRENDGASNLYFNRARYYSPQLHRFISEDPIRFGGGMNLYAYALGDPVSGVDPSGLDVTIVVNRTTYTNTSITGTITVSSSVTGQSWSGYSLENAAPANPNLPIPPGTYSAYVRTDHTPNRVELNNVPNATNVQIHNGNVAADVKGCVAAGTSQSTDFVGGSVNAMNAINNIISGDGTGNISVTINGAAKP